MEELRQFEEEKYTLFCEIYAFVGVKLEDGHRDQRTGLSDVVRRALPAH